MVINNPNKINRIQGFKNKKLVLNKQLTDVNSVRGKSLDEVKLTLHLESVKDCSDLMELLIQIAPCFIK